MGTPGSARTPVAWFGSVCTGFGPVNVPKHSKTDAGESYAMEAETQTALAPRRHLVIRVKFRNGTVREKVGTELMVEQLFEHDDDRLIDYVQGLDAQLNEFAIWLHDDDLRWQGIEL